jgi:hypothetical protein
MSNSGEVLGLTFSSQPFDLAFHPQSDVFAVGLVDGGMQLHTYRRSASDELSSSLALGLKPHEDAVRSIVFSQDGKSLFSGSTDRSIRRMNSSGQIVWVANEGHSSTVTRVLPVDESGSIIVSGDEDGSIKLWDSRSKSSSSASSSSSAAKPMFSFSNHEDAISDLIADSGRHSLVSASCDGTLSVYDLRKGRILSRTEQDDDELLSISSVKGGEAFVVGTQGGVLQIWDRGKMDSSSEKYEGCERFTGHPESIDAILQVDDDTIITGSSDGILRLITVRPNKLVGVVGEHSDFPVERLAWSRDRNLIGSISHDLAVKLWDVRWLFEEEDDEDEDVARSSSSAAAAGAGAGVSASSARSKFVSLPAIALHGRNGEDDEDEDDDDLMEDEEEEEEEEEEEKEKDVRVAPKAKKKAKVETKKGKGKFFDDLQDDES